MLRTIFHVTVVSMVLQVGSTVSVSQAEESELKAALIRQDFDKAIEIMRLNPEAQKSLSATLPLHFAAIQNRPDVVAPLIAAGADVNAFAVGETPLGLALSMGRLEVAKELVANGADIKNVSEFHGGALGVAARSCYPEQVRWLLSLGADVHQRAPLSGGMPIHFAMNGFFHPDLLAANKNENNMVIVRMLIDAGAKLDSVDNRGETCLHWAAKRGQFGVILAIPEDITAFLSIGNKHGDTALHLVCGRSVEGPRLDESIRIKTIKALLERGADPQAKDDSEWTPIDYAKSLGSPTINSILAEHTPK